MPTGGTLFLERASQPVPRLKSKCPAHGQQRSVAHPATRPPVERGSVISLAQAREPVPQLSCYRPARQQQLATQGRQAVQHIWHFYARKSVLIATLAIVMSTADFVATTGMAAGDARRHQPKARILPLVLLVEHGGSSLETAQAR